MLKLPFMMLRGIPEFGAILRQEAATTTGQRARASYEQLTPAVDPAAVATVLAQVKAHDPGFNLAATTRGVERARQAVHQARQAGDASAARPVLSDGLWNVFAMVLESRTAHGVRREETSRVVRSTVVAAYRDQLAEQLRIRLSCAGERSDAISGLVLRGQPGLPATWDEDWIIRRAATATTPENGGVLGGRCPHCGAALAVDPGGSCTYCGALVLTGGEDWVVWSIEEAPW
jgi:predicted lipid-binding transport protein (Tim44 family)